MPIMRMIFLLALSAPFVAVVIAARASHDHASLRGSSQAQLQTLRESSFFNSDSTDSAFVPDWLQDYLHWHREERARLTEKGWKDSGARFLVMSAPHGMHSGGTTDRLRPIPALLRLAAKTNRLLMIHWERPFSLEHFLLPSKQGLNLDWRIPTYMEQAVSNTQPLYTFEATEEANDPLVSVIFMDNIVNPDDTPWDYGEAWYNDQRESPDEPEALAIFKTIWDIMFTPSPGVQALIQDNLDRLGLVPGDFATAHIRALYAIHDRPKHEIVEMAQNAMNCASNLRPGGPYFVASDSPVAIEAAIEYGKSKGVKVVATQGTKGLHVDYTDESDPSVTPAHFYDAFVDIYLMKATRCVAKGRGGFAQWGLILGYDRECVIQHSGGENPQQCSWVA